MDHIFRNLLIRYQNYLLEFYQLIEDKNDIAKKDFSTSEKIKTFLENIPEIEGSFEISYTLVKRISDLTVTWSVYISEDGFSVRSFSIEGLEEIDEWYFHYHDSTQEYEGNLFNDGDWDLFLEEIAEIDDSNGEKISYEISYKVGE